jgi:Ni2+-binding GTPase involved in maturation of urease and hydrogenase
MRVVTVAGPPSVGKTSVVIKTIKSLTAGGTKVGVVKFDALSTSDDEIYAAAVIPVATGLSGSVCPDHFFVSNIDDCIAWGRDAGFDVLMAESAGLCCRCSPHIKGVTAACVVDCLSGIHTPRKIGPMLRLADLVLITKGDIVSQAEREVFSHNVAAANPDADILFVNGMTGQGSMAFAAAVRKAPHIETLEGGRLRFPMPSAVCPYCIGETAIGRDYQRGNVRKMTFDGAAV